ncbi:MAG: permease [Actinobacteria bacterium]|nr:MAG: permease [Actinomycetota bacterium]
MLVALAVEHEVWRAASFALGMTWEVLWALILGFALSGVVQAVVSKRELRRLLPDDSPKTLAVATGLGAASSSCSYASVALARSLFRKGANFTAAMAFEIASTNLVIELGIIIALVLGWQFVVGEFAGGLLMIVLLAVLLRVFLTPRLVEAARSEAEKGRLGSMEGHAEMDMAVESNGSIWQRLRSPAGFTATANNFVMDWAAVARDVFGGLLIAGMLAAWVPDSFWQGFFFEDHHTLAKLWGPLVGPAVAILSFVCSIGNVPLAAVLWNGGISFGGVLSFIFADLIILPILNIYRRYYGWRMAAFLLGTFYATMVVAGLAIEFLFEGFGIERHARNAKVVMASVTWNYTTFLNILFLLLAAGLFWRYFRLGGGWKMLRMMNEPMGDEHHAHHPRGALAHH